LCVISKKHFKTFLILLREIWRAVAKAKKRGRQKKLFLVTVRTEDGRVLVAMGRKNA
jgi:hypothetical protein